jgi:hypothetical protein
MEYNIPEPIVTERHSYLNFLLILLMVALVMSAALHGYLWYQKKQLAVNEIAAPAEQPDEEYPGSYGLDGEVVADNPAVISGVVYFNSSMAGASGTAPVPHTFRYSVVDKKVTPVGTQSQSDWQRFGSTTAAVLATTSTAEETALVQPQQYNLKTGVMTVLKNVGGSDVENLAVSPNGTSYAYSYQSVEQTHENNRLIQNWNIAIHTKDGAVVKIEKAHEPKWLPNGTQILYVAEDGVHRYDIPTKTDIPVFSNYAPHSRFDDIAVSPDGQTVILTKPNTNLLAVTSFTDAGLLQEVGRIISEDTGYSRPLFSFNGQFYAVIATTISDIKNVDGQYTYTPHSALEVRSTMSTEVLQSVPLPDASEGSIQLSSWLPE